MFLCSSADREDSSERGSCTDCELTVSPLCQHRKEALFAAGLDYFFFIRVRVRLLSLTSRGEAHNGHMQYPHAGRNSSFWDSFSFSCFEIFVIYIIMISFASNVFLFLRSSFEGS